ncbi:unnamed protein product, partial [Urochloa humidicola]
WPTPPPPAAAEAAGPTLQPHHPPPQILRRRPSTAASSSVSSKTTPLPIRVLKPSPRPPAAHHFFVDPAVAAVGPFFAAPTQIQGGGFTWSSASASSPQPQQHHHQLQFPDLRFAPGEPYGVLGSGGGGGGRGFRSGDAVRAERPRSGAPPPGFGKPSHPPAAAR